MSVKKWKTCLFSHAPNNKTSMQDGQQFSSVSVINVFIPYLYTSELPTKLESVPKIN